MRQYILSSALSVDMMPIDAHSFVSTRDDESEESEDLEEQDDEEEEGLPIIDDDEGNLQRSECIGAGGDRGAYVYELLPEQLSEFGIFPPVSLDRHRPFLNDVGSSSHLENSGAKHRVYHQFSASHAPNRRYAYKLYPVAVPPDELAFLNHVSPYQYVGEDWQAKVLFGCLHLSLPILCVRIKGVKRGLIMPRFTNSLKSLMEVYRPNEKEPKRDAMRHSVLDTSSLLDEAGNQDTCRNDNDGCIERCSCSSSSPFVRSSSQLSLCSTLSPSFLPPAPPFPDSSFLTAQRYTPIRSTEVITAIAYQLLTAIYFCNHMVPFRGENQILYSGYTHNDIHLPNLLLNADGRLALCDFELVSPVQAVTHEEVGSIRRLSLPILPFTGAMDLTCPYPSYSIDSSPRIDPFTTALSLQASSSPSRVPPIRGSRSTSWSAPTTPGRTISSACATHSRRRRSESRLECFGRSPHTLLNSPKPPSETLRKRCPPLSRRSPDGLFASNADVWAFALVVVGLLTGVDPLFSNESLQWDFGKGPLLQPYHTHSNCVDWDKNISLHIDYLLSSRSNTATKEEAKGLLKLCSLCLVNAKGKRSATAEELLEDSVFQAFHLTPFLSEQIVQKWIAEDFQSVSGVVWN